jgi:hypothetical protein
VLKSEVRLSTMCLAAIGIFDLVATLSLIQIGVQEGNPLFRLLLDGGMGLFIVMKTVFLAGPILVLEWARTMRPTLAEAGTWAAFGLYLVIYAGQLLRLGYLYG